VVEPSLLETCVLDAPLNACSSGSELDPLVLLESPAPLDPSEPAT
jgi:hypothetical protein